MRSYRWLLRSRGTGSKISRSSVSKVMTWKLVPPPANVILNRSDAYFNMVLKSWVISTDVMFVNWRTTALLVRS